MKFVPVWLAILSILEFIPSNESLDPVSAVTGIVIVGGLIMNYKRIGRTLGYSEGCEDNWIPENLKGLEKDLEGNVFGQELAVKEILKQLNAHFHKGSSRAQKPLVLSFHGMPGTGKNYISSLIMKNMFKKGSKSQFAHFYSGILNFPIEGQLEKYKRVLRSSIEGHIKECHRSVFIFDEIDKMPDGMLDVLYPYIMRTANVGDVQYSKLVFIFLSNTGLQDINDLATRLWRKGQRRDQFDVKQFQTLVREATLKETGGLHKSRIMSKHLVDSFIPFLPLEKEHVVKCIQKEVEKMGQIMSEELVRYVVNELNFEIFSPTGCKQLGHIIHRGIYYQTLKKHDFI